MTLCCKSSCAVRYNNYPDRLYWLAFSQRRTSFCKWSWSSGSKADDRGRSGRIEKLKEKQEEEKEEEEEEEDDQEVQQEGEVVGLRSWEEMSTDHRRSDARYSSYIMHRSLLHTLQYNAPLFVWNTIHESNSPGRTFVLWAAQKFVGYAITLTISH